MEITGGLVSDAEGNTTLILVISCTRSVITYNCHLKSHAARRCRKPVKKTNTNVHSVSCSNSNSDQEDSLVANIGTNHVNKLDVIWIHLKVAGRNLHMELDTGSEVSLISLCEYS